MYSPGYMEQAPSRGHEASPQSRRETETETGYGGAIEKDKRRHLLRRRAPAAAHDPGQQHGREEEVGGAAALLGGLAGWWALPLPCG